MILLFILSILGANSQLDAREAVMVQPRAAQPDTLLEYTSDGVTSEATFATSPPYANHYGYPGNLLFTEDDVTINHPHYYRQMPPEYQASGKAVPIKGTYKRIYSGCRVPSELALKIASTKSIVPGDSTPQDHGEVNLTLKEDHSYRVSAEHESCKQSPSDRGAGRPCPSSVNFSGQLQIIQGSNELVFKMNSSQTRSTQVQIGTHNLIRWHYSLAGHGTHQRNLLIMQATKPVASCPYPGIYTTIFRLKQ